MRLAFFTFCGLFSFFVGAFLVLRGEPMGLLNVLYGLGTPILYQASK